MFKSIYTRRGGGYLKDLLTADGMTLRVVVAVSVTTPRRPKGGESPDGHHAEQSANLASSVCCRIHGYSRDLVLST